MCCGRVHTTEDGNEETQLRKRHILIHHSCIAAIHSIVHSVNWYFLQCEQWKKEVVALKRSMEEEASL